MGRTKAKYGLVPLKGLFVVRNTETGRDICEPVREGLALDIHRVANSGKVNITDRAGKDDVVVQYCSNDDYFRVIKKAKLLKLVEDVGNDVLTAEAAGRRLWSESAPFETDGGDSADYTLVPDDWNSWKELNEQLKGEQG